MSYVRVIVYSFECDEPGCDIVSPDIVPTAGVDMMRRALVELRKEGWSASGGRHLCPAHTDGRRIQDVSGAEVVEAVTW